MQVQQLPEDMRRSVRLLCPHLGDHSIRCLPDVDHVFDDDRGAADCGDVPGLLLFQWTSVHPAGATRRLDVFHTQDRLQGHVQWQGTYVYVRKESKNGGVFLLKSDLKMAVGPYKLVCKWISWELLGTRFENIFLASIEYFHLSCFSLSATCQTWATGSLNTGLK